MSTGNQAAAQQAIARFARAYLAHARGQATQAQLDNIALTILARFGKADGLALIASGKRLAAASL